MNDDEQIERARQAELAKLGVNAVGRINAASTWLDARGMPELKTMLVTAKNVEHIERMIREHTAAAPPPVRREQPSDGKLTDEQYNALSPMDRYRYAKSFQERRT
jgi:hypothetical protein